MRSLEDIKRILEKHKDVLRKEYKVREIGIFGSFVRGEEKERESYVDILVDLDDSIGLLKFVEMENYLTDLLGVKVDLVMKSALKPRIGERILKEVIYV